MSTHHPPRLCGPDCRYRSLYEGSQASLADMATKQASALNRVARLRDGVITALKQSFPAMFSDAEVRLGRRMSSCDDEIVLAYLAGFIASRPAPDLTPLVAALAELGVDTTAGTDVHALAAAVRAAAAQPRVASSSTAGSPAPAQPAAPATAPPAAQPAASAPTAAQPRKQRPAQRPSPDRPAASVPESTDDLFGPPTGVEPTDEVDLWGLFTEPEAAPEADTTFAGLFDADEPGAVDDPLSGLFDDEPPTPLVAPVELAAPVATPSKPAADPAVTGTPATQRGPLAPRQSKDPATAARPAEPAPPARSDAPTITDELVVRPGLFPAQDRTPAKATKKPRRAARTTAARPDPQTLDVPIVQTESGEISDEVYNQLVAAVCIPRPVFSSDLASLVGSAEVVAAWEQRCHAERTNSPVRFIGAKQRHKARGDLVIPFSPELRTAASEFTSSWWASCIDNRNMRGAKLYETAVLLHRFGEQIISNRIDDEATVLTMRLNQPHRGLVGIVLLLEQRLGAGELARERLAEAVEELLSGRLNLIAVLTHTAGANSLEKLSSAVREEAEQRGWSHATPVIAAHSWDFASDGGASAVQVLS